MTSASSSLSPCRMVATVLGIGSGVSCVVGGFALMPAVHVKIKELVRQAFYNAMAVYMDNSGLCPTWRCSPIEIKCAAGYKSLSGYPFEGVRVIIDNNALVSQSFCTVDPSKLSFYNSITDNFPYGIRHSPIPTLHAIAIPLILSGCGVITLVCINQKFSIPKCLTFARQDDNIQEVSRALLKQPIPTSNRKHVFMEVGSALMALGCLGTMSYSVVKLLTEKRDFQPCAKQIFPGVNNIIIDLFNKALKNVSGPNRIPCILTQTTDYYKLVLGQNYYDNSTQQLITGFQQTIELPLKNLLHKTESCVEAIFWSGDNQKVPIFLFIASLSLLIMVVVIRKHSLHKT